LTARYSTATTCASSTSSRDATGCARFRSSARAFLTSEELARLLPGRLKRYTEQTITSPTALARELARIREVGVAFDHEEHTVGISAAGIALRDPSGDFAALTVPMPTQRFVGNEDELAKALLTVKRDVEATCGFSGS
jgi:DNA-binding IclR family transcriptional regulator